MGYTEEEDKKSDFMALVDSLELVKEAVIRNDNDRAVKRIDYIFKEILKVKRHRKRYNNKEIDLIEYSIILRDISDLAMNN